MKQMNGATLNAQYSATQMMVALLQHRLYSLFDLQFMLITGCDRNDNNVTYNQLFSALPTYLADYKLMCKLWGAEHPVLKPIKVALAKICLFAKERKAGIDNSHKTVRDFSLDPKNRSFLLALGIDIINSLDFLGEMKDGP